MEKFEILIEKLINGKKETVEISKNDFYEFREIIVKREDFKRFRGIAKQGGIVVYEYLEEERN